jgi:hypothetical protein
MTSSGVNLLSGHVMRAHLMHDGTNLAPTADTVSNAAFSTSKAVNIPVAVGSNTAYVDFTAGGSSVIQNILNWAYTVN